MDQNNQQKNNFRRQKSLDGLSNRPLIRFGDDFSGQKREQLNRTNPDSLNVSRNQTGSLDNFKRPEGFHQNNQSVVSKPAEQTKRELNFDPVVIDKPKDNRRKLLGFIPFGKKKEKEPLSLKKKIFRAAAGSMAVFIILAGIFGYSTIKKILSGGGGAAALLQNVEPDKLRGEGDGRVNVLLLGRGGEGQDAPDLTDTIIIASIDPIAKEAALVSIPRDLYVEVKSLTASMKLNSVFSTGKSNHFSNNPNSSVDEAEDKGFNLLENTIESSLGLPIHYHVMLDFEGFEQAVDTVGGVTINAPDAVQETMKINGQNYFLDVEPGVQDMDGFKALAYARSRFTSPRGDFDRAVRQRLIITALKDKILTPATFGNPQKVVSLLNNFGDHVKTNFSVSDMQRLYELSQEISSDKVFSVGLSDPPNNFVQTSSVGDLSVVVPTAGVDDYSDIQYFLRNELKDSYLKDEDARIMVLNGTITNGLASTKAEELKSFGYSVSQVGNAPSKDYRQTIIVDLHSGQNRYTQSYLERRFNATAVGSLPDSSIVPGNADFVIILGTDQTN